MEFPRHKVKIMFNTYNNFRWQGSSSVEIETCSLYLLFFTAKTRYVIIISKSKFRMLCNIFIQVCNSLSLFIMSFVDVKQRYCVIFNFSFFNCLYFTTSKFTKTLIICNLMNCDNYSEIKCFVRC